MTFDRFSRTALILSLGLFLAANSPGQSLSLQTTADIQDWVVDNRTVSIEIDLLDHFEVDGVSGQIVVLDSDLGAIPVEMLPAAAPGTVTNFLKYVTDGDYDNSMIHRLVPGFVVQGGGFYATLPITDLPLDAPIQNEFNLSNTRGTLAMAKISGDPDSATSGWFISLANNASILDTQNEGFTVFARVIGSGMSVVDAIANLPIPVGFPDPFADLPLQRVLNSDITEADFVAFPTVQKVDTFPLVDSEPSFVEFTVSSSSEAIAVGSLDGSTLTLNLELGGVGTSTVEVVAEDANGNSVDLEFAVTLEAAVTTIDSDEKFVQNEAISYDIAIDSNTVWDAAESMDWVTLSATQGDGSATLTVSVAENTSSTIRSGTVVIDGNTHLIVQYGSFENWLSTKFSAQEIAVMQPSAFDADSDADGLANGVEYALNLDPTSPFSKIETRIKITSTARYLEFFPYQSGLTFDLISSADLSVWTTANDVQGEVEDGSILFPLSGDMSEFYKLEASSPLFSEQGGE